MLYVGNMAKLALLLKTTLVIPACGDINLVNEIPGPSKSIAKSQSFKIEPVCSLPCLWGSTIPTFVLLIQDWCI